MAGILLTDNQPDRIKFLIESINAALLDSTLYVASTRIQAIQIAFDHDPDVIIVGGFSPISDRYEFCRALKQDDRILDIPLLFLITAQDDQPTRIHALDAGIDAFLSYPTNETELKALLLAMCKIKAANQINRKISNSKNTDRIVGNVIESEELFRNAFEQSNVGKTLTTLDGRFHANRAFCQILGYSEEEIYHMKWQELTHPDDIDDNQKVLDSLINGENKSGRWEKRYIHKNGDIVWVDISTTLQPDQEGKPLYFITSIIDISSRKMAEEALREKESDYRTLVQNLSVGIVIHDSSSSIVLSNTSACQMLGLTDEQMKGKKAIDPDWHFLMEDNTVMPLEEYPVNRILTSGKRIENYLTGIYRPDLGKPIWVICNGYPVHDDSGQLVKVVITFANITQLMDAEESLRISEKRFRYIFNNFHDSYLQADLTGVLRMISPSAVRMFGYESIEDMLNIPASNLYADVSDRYKMISKLAVNGHLEDFICKGKRKDGSTFWSSLNIQFQYDEKDGIIGTIGVIRDISERINAEEEIIRTKKRFQTMFEQAPMGITLSNSLNGQILEVNKKFSEIVGRTRDEVKELGWMNITHPEDLAEDMDNIARMNSGEIDGYQMKKRYVRPDGSSVWVNMTITPLNTADIAHPQNLCMIEDITEHILNEDKIRTLSRAVEQSPATIVITDAKGNIEYVNPKFTEITGYTWDETIGTNPRILKSDTKSAQDYKQLWETISAGNQWHGEFLNVKKNGESFYESASISPVFDENGNITHYIAVKEDITDRKKTEEQIKTLSTVVEQSPSMILITDRSGKIEFVNSGFTAFTGYMPEEITGKIPRVFSQKHHTPETYQLLWETLRSGKVWQSEFRNRKKNGTAFWEHVTIFPLIGDHGSTSNYIVIQDDISEKKQLMDDLISSKEKAEESDRLKTAFLSNMSHEIRTPLNSIIGFSDLLLDPFFGPEKQIEFVRSIKNSGDNLLAIISDIMDISRIETGQIRIRKDNFPVDQLIRGVGEEGSFLIQDKVLEIRILMPEPNINMNGDEGRIRQILMNLLSNAIKFTAKGYIEIGCISSKKFVQFYVKDTGIGIPREFHEKVFERFRQVETANTRKYGGNGLGLAISKQLAELMGGAVWMESESGVGSTFYLSVPLKPR